MRPMVRLWGCAMKRPDLWTVHNIIAHPLSELLYLCGLTRLSHWIHDVTIPTHEAGTGRG
jgi:hypothetical protein